jgi:heterodisulfide reductase subunit B
MKIPVYWGCVVPTVQYGYELSVREIMPRLGVELVELENASCCGLPVQSINMNAAVYLAARNIAIAEKAGFTELFTVCNGCHLSLFEAQHFLSQDEKLREEVNSLLKEEELHYTGRIKIWHTIDFLHDVIGEETIKKTVTHPLNNLKVAVHYGCHILRPSSVGTVDDPENPQKLDQLVEWLGAKSLQYTEKLDCCGNMLMLSHADAAFTFTGLKLKAIQDLGAEALIDTCPSCQNMFDMRQKSAAATTGAKLSVPIIYYTQLLGLAIGISEEKLGLNLNRSPIDEFLQKVAIST